MPWAEGLTAFAASVSIARQWSVFFDLPGNVLLMANCRMRPGGCAFDSSWRTATAAGGDSADGT
ncbi:hypothetical protein ACWDA7_09905 [Streptomyces sp. NPDC001156]